MFVKFDDKKEYSTPFVTRMLLKYLPGKTYEKLLPSVSNYFTKCKFAPANNQDQRRTFYGRDCQIVFDHFTKKDSQSQITIDEVFECHLHIKGEAAIIIKERSQVYKSRMNAIAEEIILSYDKEHPLNEEEIRKKKIMSMTIDELRQALLEEKGV